MSRRRQSRAADLVSLLVAFVASAVVIGLLGAGLFIPTVGAAGALTRSSIDVFDSLPNEFTRAPVSQRSTILDAKGNVIATPYHVNRVVVPLAQVAPIMRKAQVAIEDSRFYEHGGSTFAGCYERSSRTPPARASKAAPP